MKRMTLWNPVLCWLCLVIRCVWLFTTPRTVAHQAPLSTEFSGKNTGVGCHALLQGIFPTQGSNPGLQYCRWILCHLSHQGSPRILGWVANPFSRGSSWPRNQTGISCIAGGFFTSQATRAALVRVKVFFSKLIINRLWSQTCLPFKMI